tara:strand:+ start:1563 stop:2765 length:1203 start_codon:yes stop_codon:yes gene_type:complete
MIKKTLIAIATISSSYYPDKALAIKAPINNLNPYHAEWSCKYLDNNDSEKPEKSWFCSKSKSKDISIVFDKDTSNNLKKHTTSELLGWVEDNSDSKNNCNTCNGYYFEPSFDFQDIPLSESKSELEFAALKENIKDHELQYSGNVKIRQSKRELYADKANIVYDKETKKPYLITASGNIKLVQPGEIILAESGSANLYKNESKIKNAIYLFKVPSVWSLKEEFEDKNFTGYAHGTSTEVTQINKDLYSFKNATYTTCPPTSNTWNIKAKNITINKDNERGVAKHTTISLSGVPVFYVPYFSFPIGKKRKSGFLYPGIQYSSLDNFNFSLPYYFNIAPNYDYTITPIFYKKYGVLFSNEFRLLTNNSNLVSNIDYMPEDKVSKNKRYYVNNSFKSVFRKRE